MFAVVKQIPEVKSYAWNLAAHGVQEVTPDFKIL